MTSRDSRVTLTQNQEKKMQVIALVDCDNFFVSCERVFNPSLRKKPVVVLSSNDGCVISRSEEAKRLGLKMDPYFKIKDFCKDNGVKVFSSNFALYADMSSRVMSILQDMAPEVEVYSIDEAFLNLSHIPSSRIDAFAKEIRDKILQDTGIPVSIGISSTKSLAKIAQTIAKKNKQIGIYKLLNEDEQTKALTVTSASDIWGIGRSSSLCLEDLGIYTALQFRDANTSVIRKYLKLPGQKLQHELKGISCFEIEQIHEAKQNITVSRSFSRSVVKLDEMQYAVSEFVARAAVKLRRQNSVCAGVYVYIRTGMFDAGKKYSANTIEYFDTSTNDTAKIITAAKRGLQKIFKQGYDFKKAGIVLLNLEEERFKQLSLGEGASDKKSNILSVVDTINQKIGVNTLFYLAQGVNQKWKSSRNFCSKNYTTKWNELLNVS